MFFVWYIGAMKTIIMIVLVIFITLPLYGPIPTPIQGSNHPQKQTDNSKKQTEQIKKIPPSSSLKMEGPIRKEKPSEEPDKQNNSTSLKWWLIVFPAVLAICAILQFIWIVRQGRWMRATQRAYIFVSTVSVGNIISNSSAPIPQQIVIPAQNVPWIFNNTKGPITILEIKNSGKTTAYNVRHGADIVVRGYPLHSILKIFTKGGIKSVSPLSPEGNAFKKIAMKKTLTPKQITSLIKGTKAIYVYGIITYEDIFGKQHITKYRFMQNGKTTTVGQDITMTICEEGNEAY